MELSNPIRSVIPSVQGDVLAVLARTDEPLTGRTVASLAPGVSSSGVKVALRALVESGLVTVEAHPPANLYRLNRRHLAAPAIEALASLRTRMLTAMRDHVASWDLPPWGVWLFGSAARGDGSTSSDVDVLVVRPESVTEDDVSWHQQVAHFADDVGDWTGNPCSVLEYSRSEFDDLMAGPERLAVDLRSDAIALTSRRLPSRSAEVMST